MWKIKKRESGTCELDMDCKLYLRNSDSDCIYSPLCDSKTKHKIEIIYNIAHLQNLYSSLCKKWLSYDGVKIFCKQTEF